MQVETGWVKPPKQAVGLDHLAVQAPCINIYGRLLPGITNVTDRARYYSFYTWLVWAFDQDGHREFDEAFVDRFRRADCLFALIAERHSRTAGGNHEDHTAALVGRNTLSPVIAQLPDGGSIRLSDYAHRNDDPSRYFMNKLGGLGQYYLGVLRELNVLGGDAHSGLRYSAELGGEIARRFDLGVDRAAFFEAVEKDAVSGADLDRLSSFCPCGLVDNKAEQDIMVQLLTAQGGFASPTARTRRSSLKLLLIIADGLAREGEVFTEEIFRRCIYSASFPNGRPIPVAGAAKEILSSWAVYARNELLSVAVQGIFYAVLDAYQASGLRLASSQGVCNWFLEQPEATAAIAAISDGENFAALVASTRSSLLPLEQTDHENHEVRLSERIKALSSGPKSETARSEILTASLGILIALASRGGDEQRPYQEFLFEKGYFQYYPSNLVSFFQLATGQWRDLTIDSLLGWLTRHWGIELHLSVALRKLRGQSQSTFRIRPGEQGFEVVAAPQAAATRPRFNQALRVLKDVGALELSDDKLWHLSTVGRAIVDLGDE